MTKKEAIERMVSQELNSVPQDWVKTVAEAAGDYPNLPMWGTMWIVDNFIGERLWKKSRVTVPSPEDIDLDEIERIEGKEQRETVEQAIADENYPIYEQYVDEEMAYERSVLDVDGDQTALYIYEIGDEYVIGVNGAGWDFYDGVWDRMYDTLGFHWHEN